MKTTLLRSGKNSINVILNCFFFLNIYPILNKKNISLPVKSCPNSKQPILLLSILAGSNIFEVPICIMIAFSRNRCTNVLHIYVHKHSVMKFYCTTIFSLIKKKIKENKMFLEFQYQILSKRKQCNINLTLF